MATLPRRDSDALASLVGAAVTIAAGGSDTGREVAITGALRSLPSAVRPDAGFTARLRATLMTRAATGDDGAPARVPAHARPK